MYLGSYHYSSEGIGISERLPLGFVDSRTKTLLDLGTGEILDVVDDVVEKVQDAELGAITSKTEMLNR